MDKLFQKKIWLPLALFIFAIQLAVPAYMIFEQKQILSKGDLYKFKVEPIDPYDPFRGRYVVLNFEVEQTRIPISNEDQTNDSKIDRHTWVYANLSVNKDGYAEIKSLSLTKPEKDFLRVQVANQDYANTKRYRINIPFDRYYSPENKAYAIETNVRQRSRQSSSDQVYVAVKIYKGKGTIEDLFINETPILEFVEQEQER